jgi:DNA-binding transcriptional LysR family regulator
VAAPDFASVDTHRLADYPIIHTLRRYNDWQTWCEAAGVPFIPREQGWSFESSSMSYSAAEHGLGVVMAELEFITDALAQGRLRPISPIRVNSEHHFHIAYARSQYNRPALRKFRSWMSQQMETQTSPALA